VTHDEHDRHIRTVTTGVAFAFVVGHRDRARTEEAQAQYAGFVEPLATVGGDEIAPTLALVLAAGDGPRTPEWIATVCRALRRHPLTLPLLPALADLPGWSLAAARAQAGVTRQRFSTDELQPWIAHPFWKARETAIMTVPDPDLRARVACSVWHTIDGSGLPVDVEPDGYLCGLRVPPPPRDWAAAATRYGGLIDLPPLPSLDEGARSRCADLRAWCVAHGATAPDEPLPDRLVLDDATRDRLRAAELAALDALAPRLQASVAWLQTNMPEGAP
jgi:hypothetical protein